MDENKLQKLVLHYQQKLADATLEGAQYKVLHDAAAEENAQLQERVRELEAAAAPAPKAK